MRKENLSHDNKIRFETTLKDIGIKNYEILSDDAGLWVIISKSETGVF
jgi:hypothetical protein